MNRILLISGKMGSGKTTLAERLGNYMHSVFNWGYKHVKFASPIYEMHAMCRGVLKHYDIPVSEEKDGNLLQLLGTEWGRKHLGEDVWVQCAQNTCSQWFKKFEKRKNNLIIIDDCRFENELAAFPEAFKVRLECDRDIRKERATMWRENENHPSEIGLDNRESRFDLILNTDRLNINECVLAVEESLREGWDS